MVAEKSKLEYLFKMEASMKHYVLEVFYNDGTYAEFVIVADDMQNAIFKMLDIEFEEGVGMLHLEEECSL